MLMTEKLILNSFTKKIYLILLFIFLVGNNLFSGELTYLTFTNSMFCETTYSYIGKSMYFKVNDINSNIEILNYGLKKNMPEIDDNGNYSILSDLFEVYEFSIIFTPENIIEMKKVLDIFNNWSKEALKMKLELKKEIDYIIMLDETISYPRLNFCFSSYRDSCLLSVNYLEKNDDKKNLILDFKDLPNFYKGFDTNIINNNREKLKRFKE